MREIVRRSERDRNRPPAIQRDDYKSVYRAAFDYHARHNPPFVDLEYWKEHTPGVDDPPQSEIDYWVNAAADAANIGKDPFLADLIISIYAEMEREYNRIRCAAHADNTP